MLSDECDTALKENKTGAAGNAAALPPHRPQPPTAAALLKPRFTPLSLLLLSSLLIIRHEGRKTSSPRARDASTRSCREETRSPYEVALIVSSSRRRVERQRAARTEGKRGRGWKKEPKSATEIPKTIKRREGKAALCALRNSLVPGAAEAVTDRPPAAQAAGLRSPSPSAGKGAGR